MRLLLMLCALAAVARSYDLQPPDMSLLHPQGLRMAIPDEPGISLFAVHYSINKPVPGVAAGDWNFDINSPTGDEWVHENRLVVVKEGDTVYYWILVLYYGQGVQLTDQSWKAIAATPPPPTTPPTTHRPTTTAPSFEINEPHIEMVGESGIIFEHPDYEGMQLFGGHYNINKELPGLEDGEYKFSTTSPTETDNGLVWRGIVTDGGVSVGDTIYYWVYVIHNDQMFVLFEKQWIVVETTTTPTPPPTTTPLSTTRVTTTSGPIVPDCEDFPCLIWEDNFDFLDFSKWNHEITAGGGGNWEFQYYTNNRTNSYTKDGVLYIKPTLTEDRLGPGSLSTANLDLWGMAPPNKCTGNAFYGCQRVGSGSNLLNPVQSARLRTVHTFNFRYGKVDVRARMPRGDWLWPAIWLLPEREDYGGWPASGEIDIVESRGNDYLKNEKGESVGNNHIGSTLHWGPYFPENGYLKTTGTKIDDFGHSFHKYTLEWDESKITISVDDEVVMHTPTPENGFWQFGDFDLPDESNPWSSTPDKNAPFNKQFYFIMNVAVGGTNGFFGDNWSNAGYQKPWNNQSPTAFLDFWNAKNLWYPTWSPEENDGENAAMEVDYIRVWKLR